jgi:signal transduction histidine kinase
LVPLAWTFARALSRQIRRFADAADRLGTDPNGPAVKEEGAAELRVAARALNRMQQRLVDYLNERTAMIAAIAHDLRTPLARIAFRVEAAPEPVRDKVLADVNQMQAMISATMAFARNAASPGERATMDLAGLVAAIVEQERDMERPVTLRAAEPARVNADPLALERLIQNRIDNGVAYGGAVDVALRRSGGEAHLSIADRGPGLAADALERVFQPFWRGDPSRNRETGGMGLGLTIARSVAEDHGGRLTLCNRPGGGLEALLRLPLAA